MFLSEANKKILISNAKKFGWRFLLYCVVIGSAFGIENLHLLSVDPKIAVIIGFALGEVHSWADAKFQMTAQFAARVARAFKPRKN